MEPGKRSPDEIEAAVIATKTQSGGTRAMINTVWSNFWALEWGFLRSNSVSSNSVRDQSFGRGRRWNGSGATVAASFALKSNSWDGKKTCPTLNSSSISCGFLISVPPLYNPSARKVSLSLSLSLRNLSVRDLSLREARRMVRGEKPVKLTAQGKRTQGHLLGQVVATCLADLISLLSLLTGALKKYPS